MMRLSRRSLLLAGAGAARRRRAAQSRLRAPAARRAGTRSWSAPACSAPGRRRSCRRPASSVLLLDAWGPAHARASSGGESRMTRGAYGADEVYTRMALAIRCAEWRALSGARRPADLPSDSACSSSSPQRRSLLERVDARSTAGSACRPSCSARRALRRRFPQIDFGGIDRRPLRAALRRADGAPRGPDPGRRVRPRRRRLSPGGGGAAAGPGARLDSVTAPAARRSPPTASSSPAGPGSAGSSPICSAGRIFPTRQEVFFFAPAAGRHALLARARCPAGPISTAATSITAFPIWKARGFKIAHDAHGPPMDPDTGDRTPSPQALADVRAFMARRFPDLASAAAQRGAGLPI